MGKNTNNWKCVCEGKYLLLGGEGHLTISEQGEEPHGYEYVFWHHQVWYYQATQCGLYQQATFPSQQLEGPPCQEHH